jgi:hypothetical protein
VLGPPELEHVVTRAAALRAVTRFSVRTAHRVGEASLADLAARLGRLGHLCLISRESRWAEVVGWIRPVAPVNSFPFLSLLNNS